MPHFPVFMNIKNKEVLVFGGGMVALRKIKKLQVYEPRIKVIAPKVLPDINNYESVVVEKRSYKWTDLWKCPALVIAATDDNELNHKIAKRCHRKRILVNVVDDPKYCSFVFPALVNQGEFSAGICTGGASPTASAYFKEQLQRTVPDTIDEILNWLEDQRTELKAEVVDDKERAHILRDLFYCCIEKEAPLTEEELEKCKYEGRVGSVALVGAGCGKADLITVRGLRLLQQCQAVVYDDLIDKELLEYVPESAERIYVGKRMGSHYASQEEINQKLIELAQKGLRVVRLKGGDPYLFGRGGEEMLALREKGIVCQEVPGIPSAIGIPAEAGIPVTHRKVSRGLHIVTAHTSDTEDGLPADFDDLAKLDGTLVFLMGLNQLPKIVERLQKSGKSSETPIAVISGGNAPNLKCVRSTLHEIEESVKKEAVTAPAIILVGDVAMMDVRR